MTYFRRVFLVLNALIFFVLSGCGSSDDNDENGTQWGGLEYVKISGEDIKVEGDVLSGTGSLAFKDPMATSVEAGKHVTLDFELSSGSSLILSAFANEKLEGGADFIFSISTDNKLSVLFKYGNTAKYVSEAFSEIDVTKPISLALELHNDEDQTHVFIWNADNPITGDTVLLDSHDPQNDYSFPGKGAGTYWGLTLHNATVQNASLSEPRFGE